MGERPYRRLRALAPLFLLGFLAGCATPAQVTELRQDPGGLPPKVELADVPRLDSSTHGRRTYPPEYLVDGEKAYRIGEPRGLFVMLKKDPATPDTDEGWVYGTVSADGKTVTSSGRVESCMGCHREASRDRLFGMHVNKSL